MNLKSLELLGVLRHIETWIGLSDMDAVRVCLLLVAELVFMGKEDRNCIPRHLVSLVEDFDFWNDCPWGEYMWVKFYKRTVNGAANHRALHLDKKKQNPDYYPTYNLYGFRLAFKAMKTMMCFYWKGDGFMDSVDGDKNHECNQDKQDGGDGFVDSVGGDKNHECNQDKPDQQDKQPLLADVLHELRALRKEVTLFKVDDARIAKLERILNDAFIPFNDRSKGTHNSVNPGLTTLANHPLVRIYLYHKLFVFKIDLFYIVVTHQLYIFEIQSTCSRHVVDNPARNNDIRNSNHNVVYTGLSCSANDHMSSCLSLEMPTNEVAIAGTAIHNADEMYDSPNCVTDNDVNKRIGVSSNYSMINTSCPEMNNVEVLVAGMGIDKANENIYNSNANDNDVNQGITSNSSSHEMPNVVVVVACMGIDKPDGHNDNPNANDNDVNKVIDPMSTCSGVDTHLAEVAVAGMEFDKGDGHIDIPTASGNDVNLAKSVSVNDLMVLAICSMRFQNEVALNAVCEGNVVSAKEVGENEFVDDFIDVLNDEESLPKVSLDDMNVDAQEEKLIDTVKVKKERKKSDMKTNYVLRSAKERKKRLAMALESPFGQQPPTTPIQPKRTSRSVHCDFILPPDFEENVSGQPKMRLQNCKKDKVVLACIDKSKQGWLKDSHIDLWVDLMWCFRQPDADWPWKPIISYHASKVYFPVNEPKRLSRNLPLPVHKPLQTALAYRERILQYFWTHKIEAEKSQIFNQGYERVFGDSGDSYKHYLLVSFDMINHRFQEIAIPNLLMRGLDSPLYVSKLRNSLVLSGNIPTPAYYVFVCCQLSINGGSITSFPAIMTMPTHHFTKLLGFNNQDKPIVEAATADVMGHRVQVYMENSQSFEYVDIQGNVGSFFVGENLESLILAAHPDRSLYCAG
ncbi:hypothetical protein Tco_0771314 [Tanacetum coccineum]|uniref:Phospholipase-like protein n=1 Tax=Tanacetum coccineum TaxID=301880 RepID=A0ABQ4ZEP5_9ASTR